MLFYFKFFQLLIITILNFFAQGLFYAAFGKWYIKVLGISAKELEKSMQNNGMS